MNIYERVKRIGFIPIVSKISLFIPIDGAIVYEKNRGGLNKDGLVFYTKGRWISMDEEIANDFLAELEKTQATYLKCS